MVCAQEDPNGVDALPVLLAWTETTRDGRFHFELHECEHVSVYVSSLATNATFVQRVRRLGSGSSCLYRIVVVCP